MPKNGLGF